MELREPRIGAALSVADREAGQRHVLRLLTEQIEEEDRKVEHQRSMRNTAMAELEQVENAYATLTGDRDAAMRERHLHALHLLTKHKPYPDAHNRNIELGAGRAAALRDALARLERAFEDAAQQDAD